MKHILTIASIFFFFCGLSQPYKGKKSTFTSPKGASCAPSNSSSRMEYNNVRALIHTGGNLYQIPGQPLSMYEVPKNSGIIAFFASALWLGGTDVNGQLKLAALRYREGNDYWTGPLTNITAEIQASECFKYDTHFQSSQDLVREFNSWYNQGLQDEIDGTDLQSSFYPGYKIPRFITEWPAHGDPTIGQDYYLAPFYDRDLDGNYNVSKGDYPWYDINLDKECTVDRRVSLYGDFNLWWIMNDKGNIHTETGGEPIGMEIRAQSFAFATSDDINNATFLNYELINRGTNVLYDTYFGIFIDGALGNPFDDFVGCDVGRGLGYLYNGDAYDEFQSGFNGYGNQIPAAGVDFFEGPFQDNDSIDNPVGINENEALNGIGFGDGIVDNERFGMRRFLYYVNVGGSANINQTDPINASDYYNFLRGRWKDNTPFFYGGTGHISDPSADPTTPCEFLFPGDTDPLGWGTNGVAQPFWTEQTAGNEPYDRRFVQSAGPFVLKPGAVNNITVGMVWARSTGGDPFQSVVSLRRADDRAQALFENCFRVIEGPHAPELTGQELENEVILMLDNRGPSNNKNEGYVEIDPFISSTLPDIDKKFRFQGYMIYQLANNTIRSSDITDPTKARLVAQCDIKDDVSRLINFEYDQVLDKDIPTEKVDGDNLGIRHSFKVTQDLFAQGDTRLVNFKKYYYLAIAYAYNNFKTYSPNDASLLDGQKVPFLPSRKAAIGEIKVLEMIPHPSAPEQQGTILGPDYGFQPEITRLDGRGNGFNSTDLTEISRQQILNSNALDKITYAENAGPINIKVIDPLNVADGFFTCKFKNNATNPIDSANYTIYRFTSEGGVLLDSVSSNRQIFILNEQLIPKWGISVTIVNKPLRDVGISSPVHKLFNDPIGAELSFSDPLKPWLTTINDADGYQVLNWIRSGNVTIQEAEIDPSLGFLNPDCFGDRLNIDPEQLYEKLLGGGVSHFSLVASKCDFMPLGFPSYFNPGSSYEVGTLARASNVDIVFTKDKSLWTRCPVIELCRSTSLAIGNAQTGELRAQASVDKQGQADGSGNGMSWFPGYAIDLDNGKRLQIAFGENSFFSQDNGADLIWNPSARIFDENGIPTLGGMHPIYVFGYEIGGTDCPAYDQGAWLQSKLNDQTSSSYKTAFSNLMWVVFPTLREDQQLNSCDASLKIRINKPYEKWLVTGENNGLPMYSWNMDKYQTLNAQTSVLKESLKLINVVPNPYYAYSEYERNKVDTRVKVTNLPTKCTVSIFNTSGKLINQFKKDNQQTYLDWLLINQKGIPVSSGVYLIHVEVPDVGERVLKAFIAMRQFDAENF